eukprot:CAMPEP_0178375236 /NCGR_PEP_ID=MMETSP0689_2-20121128/2782_1 /TAXON_ID=160604 /ORGANISM="Amphidinium massartii, Strain CS-259" /LENGTH=55 /DNA_ID=CAMNT_0019995219 /DNA_START=84 /DNA_END=248 /DNA_ORIENTATION=+
MMLWMHSMRKSFDSLPGQLYGDNSSDVEDTGQCKQEGHLSLPAVGQDLEIPNASL